MKRLDRKSRMTPIWQEDMKMKTNELKVNEMEQVSGGNFFADLEDVLRRIFGEPNKPATPNNPTRMKAVPVRVKC